MTNSVPDEGYVAADSDQDLIPPDELIASQGIGRGGFREIGEGMFTRFRDQGLISGNDVIVDIGCGLGRVARPLTRFLSRDARYHGFDINRASIEWCREKYARFPNFRFDWIDLHSVYYNRNGRTAPRDFKFPLRDGSVDFVFLSSVFTHMFMDDVGGYLRELARMLRPGKRCYSTYFLIDPRVAAWLETGGKDQYHAVAGGRVRDRDCPETMVLLEEDAILSLHRTAGLEVQSKTYGTWADETCPSRSQHAGYQDRIVAIKT